MSVNIETATQSMSKSLDLLRETPLVMHRVWFQLTSVEIWYAIMKEARAMYGKNWKAQPKIKRKLGKLIWHPGGTVCVWFDVPDPAFGTWVAVKHAVIVTQAPDKYNL